MLSRYSYPFFTKPGFAWRALTDSLVVLAGLLAFDTTCLAQIPPKGSASAVMSPASATATLALPTGFNSPTWVSLTVAQQSALKPLAASWANLSDGQKRKWISLSANFPQLSAAEQSKLHERMAQWAALSPRQREQARLNFADAKQVTPQQKSEQWQAYQALSPEEKQKLAKAAQPKPPRTAIAAQPVASDKINRLPLVKSDGGPGLPAANTSVPNSTLLVRPKPPTPPVVQAASAPAAPAPPTAPASMVMDAVTQK